MTVGTPDPMHCAQRGAMDTSQEKVSGLGGRTDCGRVVALGPILALVLFTWPQSCLVPGHRGGGPSVGGLFCLPWWFRGESSHRCT